ncbi:MAG: lipopolysaccharide heptosyltransferase II [Candidatus Firestonebacteria bacterium]
MGIEKKQIKNILIRGASWIGDSVVSMPVIKALRENFPSAYIALSVKSSVKEIWDDFPYVDLVVSDEEKEKLRSKKYDLGIVLPHSFSAAFNMKKLGVKRLAGYPTELRGIFLSHKVPRPAEFRRKHLLEEYLDILRHLGLKAVNIKPFLHIPPRYETRIKELLRIKKIESKDLLVGICPGAAYGPAKVWPAKNYAKVVKLLVREYGAKAAVFGGSHEKEIVKSLLKEVKFNDIMFTSGSLSVLESAALMKRCNLFISNDTGPMHMAAALNLPLIAIFGSTDPGWTGPLGKNSKVIYRGLTCSPCFDRTCGRKKNKYECLTDISPEEVFKLSEVLLKRKN